MSFFYLILVEKYEIDCIFTVIKPPQKSVFPVLTLCLNIQFFFDINGRNIQFFCNFKRAHGLLAAQMYDLL